jgi:hypothetical protein
MTEIYTLEEVNKHIMDDDIWMIIHNKGAFSFLPTLTVMSFDTLLHDDPKVRLSKDSSPNNVQFTMYQIISKSILAAQKS